MYPNSSFIAPSNGGHPTDAAEYNQSYPSFSMRQTSNVPSQVTGYYGPSLQNQQTGYPNANQLSAFNSNPQQQELATNSQSTGHPLHMQSAQQSLVPAPTGQTSAEMAESFQHSGGAQAPVRLPPTGVRIPKIRLSFLTAQDQARFEQLFKSAVGNGQALSGNSFCIQTSVGC